MPSTFIDHARVEPLLREQETPDNLVTTPFGLTILEIQGVLNLPAERRDNDDQNYIKIDEIYDAVKFGRLAFDETDNSKVTLYIGNSQRLLGRIVDLKPPLGVLKIATDDSKDVSMIDIVRKKMIFSTRPLPIM